MGKHTKNIVKNVNIANIKRSMIVLKGIKAACKWLNHADREVSARNNMFYDTKTNELLAEVKLKDENGNKY